MGIPLETGGNDAWFDDEIGYRVDRAAYALPEIELQPGRAGGARPRLPRLAAGQPGRRRPSRARAQAQGRRRRAGPGQPGRASSRGSAPASRPSSRSTRRCATGARSASPTARPAGPTSRERHLEPWGDRLPARPLVRRRPRPRLRGATRVFRLSRIAGPVRAGRRSRARSTVPEGIDLRAQVATLVPAAGDGRGPAVRPARARGSGCAAGPRASATRRGRPAGWTSSRSPFSDLEVLAEEVAGYRRRRRRPGAAASCGRPSSAGCAACWRRPPGRAGVVSRPRDRRRHRPPVPAARPGAVPGQPAGHPAGRGRRASSASPRPSWSRTWSCSSSAARRATCPTT